ncbi:MAG: pilus assembly protein, partial [Caldimicrobium thiodismutans]
GATPTGPVLWDAYNYFSQSDPQFGGFSPQRGAGDEWKNYMYQCYDNKRRDGNCQGNEFIFVPCAKNFIILLSDGQWNRGASGYTCSIDNGFEDSSADPVVPAYWLHKKGFYNQAANNTYSYIEAIYAIGLYLGGTGERSLKNVAMYGAFDRSKTWPDGLSGYPMATCGPIDDCCDRDNCGKGSSCTDLPPSSSDWDADRNGIPDTFYSANNAKELKDSILNAILDILRRASSGATVATLSQRYTAGSLLFQPYFYPGTNGTEFASWIGFLKALWVDAKGRFREETERNFILNLLRDYWVQFVTEGNSTTYFKITNDTTCSYLQVDRIEDISHIFESGCLLAKSPPENRKIYVNFNGNMVSFESGTPSLLNYLQSLWSSSAGESVNATCLLEYIRGKDRACDSTYVLRPRTVDLGTYCLGESGKATWKLGDIFFSTPVVISNRPLNTYHLRYYDQSYLEYLRSDSYRRRNNYIFVGANDGMLHVFRAGWMQFYRPPDEPLRLIDAFNLTTTDLIGKEEWAFIPQNALPYLVWYGHKDYCHIPLIDYKVTLFDAKIKGKWETLLLGMMGFGGKAINANGCPNGKCSSSLFLLKLKFKSDGTFDDPPFELLWEKQLPDNTLTLSYPVILKYSNGSDWSQSYIVLGSGPKEVTGMGEPYKVEFIATPKIYFINLETGEISKEIPIPGVSNQAVGSLRAVDYDNDYRDDLIYFGTYNLGNGGLFRLSLRSTNGTYKDISSLSSSDITQVLSDLNRPVFASPELTVDPSGALWVIFGTGVYFEKSIIDYTNYFVGLKDFCKFGNCTYSFSQLTDRTNYCGNKANYISLLIFNATEQTCKCNSSSGCSNFNETTTLFKFNYTDYPALGWYHLLRTNERMYSTPIVLQGMVNTLSFLPNTDLCSRGGETYYYMVCYQEGCPCYNMRGEEAPVVSKFFGIGAPPIGQPFQVLKTTKGTMIISQTSGGPPSVAPKPQIQPQGIFILWQEK